MNWKLSPAQVDSAEEADVMFIGFWADLLCRMSQDTKDDAHSAALWADCQKVQQLSMMCGA